MMIIMTMIMMKTMLMTLMILLFSEIGWKVDVDKFDFSGEPEPAYSCISPIR